MDGAKKSFSCFFWTRRLLFLDCGRPFLNIYLVVGNARRASFSFWRHNDNPFLSLRAKLELNHSAGGRLFFVELNLILHIYILMNAIPQVSVTQGFNGLMLR